LNLPRPPAFAPILASLALASLLGSPLPARADPPAPPAPPAGPVIDLAPEDQAKDKAAPAKPTRLIAFGTGTVPDPDLVRSLTDQRFREALASLAHTSVGGYGELQVTGLAQGSTPRDWTADVRRVVLFVAHSFTDDIRVYTELELEHANEAEIEQAFIDWKVAGDYLGLRAGLILVPMGITNEIHEPPAFNGVARPSVETVVIPSTWREVGGGFFGHPVEPLRYELYGMAGLDPLGFSAAGFGAGSGAGEVSKAKDWALAGRVEYEPILGAVLGGSIYLSNAGKNGTFYLADKAPVALTMPVYGYSLDARLRRGGVEAKMLYTEWRMPDAGSLMYAYAAPDGKTLVVPDRTRPVPTLLRGGYVELGYDVLHPAGVSHQLVPFVRVEAYDTQAAVPQRFVANGTYDLRDVTMGVSYRPIREVVVKADYLLRHARSGPDANQASFGVGFMY
jgi:hypothetical protein